MVSHTFLRQGISNEDEVTQDSPREGNGMCAKSWSMNCAHCITDRVKVVSGLSMSTRMVLLMLRAPVSLEPSLARVRNAARPEDRKGGGDLLLCLQIFPSRHTDRYTD